MDLLVFGSAYWDEPLWTNKQHISSRLAARGHRVLYVEPGFARPILKGRLTGHRREGFPRLPVWGLRQVAESCWVASPLLLPLRRGPEWLLAGSWRVAASWLRGLMRGLGFGERWAYLVYYPEGVRLLDHLAPAVTLYDCVDDLASQPQFATRPALAASLRAAEAKLVARANCVTATARPLWELRRRENPRAYYVHNVADSAHFGRARELLPEPEALRSLPHPRVGFVGALDPYKLDYELLSAMAEKAPELSFVLAGPESTTVANPEAARLRAHANVHFLGTWPYAGLPALLSNLDCLLLPYRQSEHTRYVFPMKFFEFLATGKPIVATPLPSLEEFAGLLPCPTGPDEWLAQVRAQLAGPDLSRDRRLELAGKNTWEQRTGRLEEILQGCLDGRPPEPG